MTDLCGHTAAHHWCFVTTDRSGPRLCGSTTSQSKVIRQPGLVGSTVAGALISRLDIAERPWLITMRVGENGPQAPVART